MQFEILFFSEIDEYAIESYSAIHNVSKEKNLGDITKIDVESLPKDFTILTHGSPCTDFSKAGRQKGGDKGSGTASSLMWNSVEIIRHCKPKFVLWENVDNVLSYRHKHNFDAYIEELSEIGYNSYYKLMNARNYGWPQNRNRVFVLSIRKDIDKGFEFPEEIPLLIDFRDLLDLCVSSSYFCDDIAYKFDKFSTYRKRIQEKDYCDTLCALDSSLDCKNIKVIRVGDKLRKLTPSEYWRVMGFADEDIVSAELVGVPEQELYKQAGNSICVKVLKLIYKNIINQYGNGFIENTTVGSLFSGVGAFEMALRDMY